MQQAAVAHGADGGRARLVVDQRQLADQRAGTQHGKQAFLPVLGDDRGLHHAAPHDVAAVAGIAGMEQDVAGTQRNGVCEIAEGLANMPGDVEERAAPAMHLLADFLQHAGHDPVSVTDITNRM